MNELLATVMFASLLGSLHCVGMCGGFVAFYASDRGAKSPEWLAHAAYNLGRLVTYVALGAIAGALGAAVNLAGDASGVGHLAGLVCGLLIVVWGSLLFAQASGATWSKLQAPIWFNRLFGRWLTGLRSAPAPVRGAALGVSSALLPCGWLYGFAATAAGTGSASMGAVVMAAFWIGTVPAMLGVGLGAHRLAKALGPRLGLLMPATLVLMGVLVVAQRGFLMAHSPAPMAADHCAGQ